MKILPWRLPLIRFMAKTVKVNKPGMKNFLKKKICRHEWCEKLGLNPN